MNVRKSDTYLSDVFKTETFEEIGASKDILDLLGFN